MTYIIHWLLDEVMKEMNVYFSIIREAPRPVRFDVWQRAPDPPGAQGHAGPVLNHGSPQPATSSEESDSADSHIPPLLERDV